MIIRSIMSNPKATVVSTSLTPINWSQSSERAYTLTSRQLVVMLVKQIYFYQAGGGPRGDPVPQAWKWDF